MTDAAEHPPVEEPDYQVLAAEAVASTERQPGNVALLLHAAGMLLRAGDVARSIRFARDAVIADPASVAALRTLSGILNVAGDRAEAIRTASDAAALDPANAELRLHLGSMLAAERRWREAAEHLSLHVVSPAATPVGWRLLSSVLHQAGNAVRAIDAAREAVTADPGNVEYRLNLVAMLNARALYDLALREAYAALAQAPADATVWRALSGVHVALGQLSEALQAAERAAKLAPGDAEYRANLVHVETLCEVPAAAADPAVEAAMWAVGAGQRNRRRAISIAPTLREDTFTRGRVIYAIMLRDIRTRFGNMKLGYVWALMEPITHLVTLGAMFYLLNHGPPPVGDNYFLYYITGLIPYLMFAHISNDVMNAAADGSVMLQLPIVKRTDIMAANAVRQFATEIWVGIIIFSIAGLLGEQAVPVDPLTAAAAVVLLGLLGIGVGAFNLVILEMFPSYQTLYNSVIRLLYFGSGIYYSPINMPDWIREALAWNPILQGIEMFRGGFYPHYHPHWLDVRYLELWVLGSLVIGLSLERAMRPRMEVQA